MTFFDPTSLDANLSFHHHILQNTKNFLSDEKNNEKEECVSRSSDMDKDVESSSPQYPMIVDFIGGGRSGGEGCSSARGY